MAVRGWHVICDANTRHFEFPTDNMFLNCVFKLFCFTFVWHTALML